MEQGPRNPESIEQAPISYEDFMDFILHLDHSDEELPQSTEHAFYRWATQTYDVAKDIDGTTLEVLYKTNVLEKYPPMTESEFAEYCMRMNLPYYNGGASPYVVTFRIDQKHFAEKYEAWAHEQGIKTAPGSIMQFTDQSGNTVRLYTDVARRGQSVDSPGYRPDGMQDPAHDSEE